MNWSLLFHFAASFVAGCAFGLAIVSVLKASAHGCRRHLGDILFWLGIAFVWVGISIDLWGRA